jgi:hypothetical protein
MENFILNIWNAYTLIDVVLITLFALLWLVCLFRLKQAKKKLKDNQFFSDCSAQTIEDYEQEIRVQECKEKELRKSFEDAVAEITNLRSTHNIILGKVTYWRERALHQKHTTPIKQTDYKYWECRTDTLTPYFEKWKTYRSSKTQIAQPGTLSLIDEKGTTYLVYTKDFIPVKE